MIYESEKSSFGNIIEMLTGAITGTGKADTETNPKEKVYTLKKVLLQTFNDHVYKYIDKSEMFEETPSKVIKKFSTIGGISFFFMSFFAGIAAFIFGTKTWKIKKIGVEKLSESLSLKNFLSSRRTIKFSIKKSNVF
jgi:hypothetical protein